MSSVCPGCGTESSTFLVEFDYLMYEDVFTGKESAWRETGTWDDDSREIEWRDKEQLDLDDVAGDTVTVFCEGCNHKIGSRPVSDQTIEAAIVEILPVIFGPDLSDNYPKVAEEIVCPRCRHVGHFACPYCHTILTDLCKSNLSEHFITYVCASCKRISAQVKTVTN